MNPKQTVIPGACEMECEKRYRDCLRQGKDEVFCRIRRVPCDSQCHERAHKTGAGTA